MLLKLVRQGDGFNPGNKAGAVTREPVYNKLGRWQEGYFRFRSLEIDGSIVAESAKFTDVIPALVFSIWLRGQSK